VTQILTIAGPAPQPIAAIALLTAAGARPGTPDWLSPGEAFDIAFEPAVEGLEPALRAAYPGCDLVVQPATHRRKKLLVTDMDSTVITVECIDEMADLLGLKPKIAAITERAMRGEIDFAVALRERVALLAGLSLGDLQRVYDQRVVPMPGARRLVRTMRRHGAHTALVSGGFDFFTGRVAAALGFDEHRGNRLIDRGGRLTGEVAEPIQGAEAKLAILTELTGRLGLGRENTLAMGDGANDIPMLEAAGLGIAFRAKPKAARAARARIDFGDLTVALYFQGYRRDELVE